MLEVGFTLNKREFRDGLKWRYDWPFKENPSKSVCGESFNMDHAMICRRGGFIIQRHNELRDLEAELLSIVCIDVQIEPALQEVNGEALKQGPNQAPDARLDVHACDFWEKQRSAFFDVRVCHPNAESYRETYLPNRSTVCMRMRTNVYIPDAWQILSKILSIYVLCQILSIYV